MAEHAPRSGDRGARRLPRPPVAWDGEVRLGRRNLLWLGIAIGVVGVGFIALALGSTRVAPILLVGGYLVLVPYGLMTRGGA